MMGGGSPGDYIMLWKMTVTKTKTKTIFYCPKLINGPLCDVSVYMLGMTG